MADTGMKLQPSSVSLTSRDTDSLWPRNDLRCTVNFRLMFRLGRAGIQYLGPFLVSQHTCT